MVKLISLRDETYKKLATFKKAGNMSFSEAIELLLNFYKTKKEKTSIKSLKGIIKESDLIKSRIKKITNG
jgi:predicted CopG family antitoxin